MLLVVLLLVSVPLLLVSVLLAVPLLGGLALSDSAMRRVSGSSGPWAAA